MLARWLVGKRVARELAQRMDDLEARVANLRDREKFDRIRADLDGNQIMRHLGVRPGRAVGDALGMLLEMRLEEGPLGEEEAYRRLERVVSQQSS